MAQGPVLVLGALLLTFFELAEDVKSAMLTVVAVAGSFAYRAPEPACLVGDDHVR